jgi:outer membrane PBP1 activator LpoA protein
MPSRRLVVVTLAASALVAPMAGPLSALAQGRANEPPPDPSEPRPRVRLGSGSTQVALLLPRQDGPFARAASALLAGATAAHARDGQGVVLEAIELDDQADEIALVLGELRERRFSLVLGPLTRNGATALVDLGPPGIPTLVLNLPEGNAPLPSQLAFFGLATEGESRHAAALAFEQAVPRAGARRPRAMVITVASPLARRSGQAFQEAWLGLGGDVRESFEFAGPRPPRDLRARLGKPAPDVVFLAMGPEQARVLRSGLAPETAVWGTSLASVGTSSRLRLPELDGMRVLEMPWELEPDHPAVVTYAKAPAGFNVEMQRLYAFGIDAFRAGRQMLAGGAAFELDGVTGRLRFDPLAGPRIERVPSAAEYREGAPVPLGPS